MHEKNSFPSHHVDPKVGEEQSSLPSASAIYSPVDPRFQSC